MTRTVRVRIAVAVDPEGGWGARGYRDLPPGEAYDFLIDDLEPGEARYFVEADLPIPEPVTVEGWVSKA